VAVVTYVDTRAYCNESVREEHQVLVALIIDESITMLNQI